MNASSATQKRLVVSFVLLLIVVGAFIYFVFKLDAHKGLISFVPFTSLIASIFIWQMFALSRDRRSFVLWILVVLYAVALVPLIVQLIRDDVARQLW